MMDLVKVVKRRMALGTEVRLHLAFSRAYHLFEEMVDAHCVRDEGAKGCAPNVGWLVAFH